MDIRATQVKELRNRTGAGMMECKKALVEVNGDLDKAIDFLREKGLSASEKKSGRITAEGLVHAYVDPNKEVGALVEVNCETDFVAKNSLFKKFVQSVAELVAVTNPIDNDDLVSKHMPDGITVGETVKGLIHSFGENVTIRRFIRFEVDRVGCVYSYIHEDYLTEGKLGVLIETTVNNYDTLTNPDFAVFMRSLLLHIAASRPEYLSKDDVPTDVIEREKSIIRSQAIQDGKSEAIVGKIVQGALDKFVKESCLLEQNYVKENEKNIHQVLQEMNMKFGNEKITITRFAYFVKGEVIDKGLNHQ